jgi:hypothetical protein
VMGPIPGTVLAFWAFSSCDMNTNLLLAPSHLQ